MSGGDPPPPCRLSWLRIAEMNLGFLGLQFSFGLQQANMAPIYAWLGANEARLPILQLAGPMTGLIVQPLIGALSDRTRSRFGRRTPYMAAGALLCSLALLAMPLSGTILMAASLLWLLDGANNLTLEPYRAYVGDRLPAEQHAAGYLCQSAFTGLAQTLAYLVPSLLVYRFGIDRNAIDIHHIPLVTHGAFLIGAVLSAATILYSIRRVPERSWPEHRLTVDSDAEPSRSLPALLREIWEAVLAAPPALRRLVPVFLLQWYAITIYWSYVPLALARATFHTADKQGPAFRTAVLTANQLGAAYNLVAFLAALAMVPIARRLGAGTLHGLALAGMGAAMIALPTLAALPANATAPVLGPLSMPDLGHHKSLLPVALGIGIGWASMMGNPFVIVAGAIPPERRGVYMGVLNMLIVVPMLINSLSFGWVYSHVLGSDPGAALVLAGALMLAAALAMVRVPGRPAIEART